MAKTSPANLYFLISAQMGGFLSYRKTAKGLSSETFDHRINETSSMLPALEPKNPTEALLLGQFLALNDSGMECLRLANLPDQRLHCIENILH
jgi:hypothetical protein